MGPQEILNTARLFWPFAKQSFVNEHSDFDLYAKGFSDGFNMAKATHDKTLSDRELKIGGLLSTIEELKTELRDLKEGYPNE